MLAEIPKLIPDVAARVIAKFGGKTQLAAVIGLPYQTVHYWEKTGNVPEKYRLGLLILARREGVDLTPYDFIAYMLDIKTAA